MPKIDGYEVCKRLKTDPEAKDIPIIIFSASQRKGFEDRYRALGVNNFIFKPFDSKELLDMIKKVIAKG
jgi:CheY-like chemotaxis protein